MSRSKRERRKRILTIAIIAILVFALGVGPMLMFCA